MNSACFLLLLFFNDDSIILVNTRLSYKYYFFDSYCFPKEYADRANTERELLHSMLVLIWLYGCSTMHSSYSCALPFHCFFSWIYQVSWTKGERGQHLKWSYWPCSEIRNVVVSHTVLRMFMSQRNLTQR